MKTGEKYGLGLSLESLIAYEFTLEETYLKQ